MKKILVPTDFSKNAMNASIYAVQFAEATNRAIVFTHVAHSDIPTSSSHTTYVHKVEETLEQAKLDLIDNVSKVFAEMHLTLNESKVHYDVRFGYSAQDKIIEAADELNVDMIIMGTQGATGLAKIFVGSNTTGVLKNVNCPVLAVPAKAKYKTVERIGYSSDLVHVKKEVDLLLPIVKSFNAQLDIFNVYPVYPVNLDYEKLSVKDILEELKLKYDNITLTVIHRAVENDLEGGMESFIKSHKPDLLVMFSQSRNWFQRLIHPSATEAIILDIKVPLLSFKA